MDDDVVVLSSDDEEERPPVADAMRGKDCRKQVPSASASHVKNVAPVAPIGSTSCQKTGTGHPVVGSKQTDIKCELTSKVTKTKDGRASDLRPAGPSHETKPAAGPKAEHKSRPKVRVKTEAPQTMNSKSESGSNVTNRLASPAVSVRPMDGTVADVSQEMQPLDDCDLRDASPSPVVFPEPPDDYDPDKRRPYQCEYCNGKFLSTILLRHHILLHEEQLKSTCIPFPQYECVICNRKFLYHQSRANHMLLKHPHHFCPPVLSLDEQLKQRSDTSPEPPKKVEKRARSEVTDSTAKQIEIKKRVAVDFNVPKVSDGCDPRPQTVVKPQSKPAKRRSPRINCDFKLHSKSETRCPSCLKFFSDPFQFKHHDPCLDEKTIRVANGYKCIVCSLSNRTFRSLSDLRSHWQSESQTHKLPPFSCVYCETEKYLLYEMEMHVLQKHPDKLIV